MYNLPEPAHSLAADSPVLTHWLRFVYQHRHLRAKGSHRLPARELLFGACAATLGRGEKLRRLRERLSTPTVKSRAQA